jgi:hypothetical protein
VTLTRLPNFSDFEVLESLGHPERLLALRDVLLERAKRLSLHYARSAAAEELANSAVGAWIPGEMWGTLTLVEHSRRSVEGTYKLVPVDRLRNQNGEVFKAAQLKHYVRLRVVTAAAEAKRFCCCELQEAAFSPPPQDRYDAENADLMRAALTCLTPEEAMALRLRMEGKSQPSVAAALGITRDREQALEAAAFSKLRQLAPDRAGVSNHVSPPRKGVSHGLAP